MTRPAPTRGGARRAAIGGGVTRRAAIGGGVTRRAAIGAGVTRRATIRGGALPRRRAVAAALGLAIVLAAALASPARAGTFRVSQCNAVDQGGLLPLGYQASLWSVSNGWPEVECGSGGGTMRFGTANWRLPEHGDMTARVAVPSSMPGTALRTAWLDWRFTPQSHSTNPAFFMLAAAGARLFVAYPGNGTPPGAASRHEVPAGARALELGVWCSPVNGPGWCNWPGALFEVRGLTMALEESGEPSAAAGGALAAGGAHAGVVPLELTASDGDSGVRHVAVSLGGTPVGELRPADGCRDDRLPPCPQALRGTVDVDTRRVPDGPQRLRLRVTDAAGNVRVVDAATVTVANQPPRVDTPAPPDTAGPGSGHGSGPTTPDGPTPTAPHGSGPTAPHASAPATQAPFPPNPLAGRGHVPNGRHATEHARVRAWLELPAARAWRGRKPAVARRGRKPAVARRGRKPAVVRRRTVTVPYGVRVRIRGRLTNRRGRPIGRAALAAVRRERGGPWQPVTGVRTRPNGRFTAFTRIGPSQEVRFVYYAYGDSTHGRRSRTLRVRVRRE